MLVIDATLVQDGHTPWPEAYGTVGAGLACNVIGECCFFFTGRSVMSFPVLGDFFCLAMFPLLVAGIVLMAPWMPRCQADLTFAR